MARAAEGVTFRLVRLQRVCTTARTDRWDAVRVAERLGMAWLGGPDGLPLRRCGECGLGRLASAELAGTLGFGVDLGSEEERERAEPEPGEHDDHDRERAPGLVVGAEPAHVQGEGTGGRRTRPRPRAQCRWLGSSSADGRRLGRDTRSSRRRARGRAADRPLGRPPEPLHECLGPHRGADPAREVRPQDKQPKGEHERKAQEQHHHQPGESPLDEAACLLALVRLFRAHISVCIAPLSDQSARTSPTTDIVTPAPARCWVTRNRRVLHQAHGLARDDPREALDDARDRVSNPRTS